jgi:general secretion pathway protein E/type IV pilus assembly protein PilB
MDAIDSISHVTQRSIVSRVAPLQDIERAIEQFYESAQVGEVDEIFENLGDDDNAGIEIPSITDANGSEDEAPIIRYVQMVISEAIKRRASDIHMEPLEKRFTA